MNFRSFNSLISTRKSPYYPCTTKAIHTRMVFRVYVTVVGRRIYQRFALYSNCVSHYLCSLSMSNTKEIINLRLNFVNKMGRLPR
jgi:hypothetical protein